MAPDPDIERLLGAIGDCLNQQALESWDRRRVQGLVDQAVGSEAKLQIDDGGGVHDERRRRIGAIRRTTSGEWFIERQNEEAPGADAPIPATEPQD